jgi:membrane protease YdiL (CAAX protease family)
MLLRVRAFALYHPCVSDPVFPPPAVFHRDPRGGSLALGIGLCLALQVVLAVCWIGWVIGASIKAGKGPPDAPTPGPVAILVMGVADAIAAVIVTWYFTSKRAGRPLREGLSLGKPSRRSILLAIAMGGICILVKQSLLVLDAAHPPAMFIKLVSVPGGFLAFATLGALSPFYEEIYYRGFFFPALERSTGRKVAWVTVTLWFTLAHAPQYWPSAGAIGSILLLSIATTTFRAATGSVVPGIIVHAVFNWTGTVMALLMTKTSA